jgi:hypothetical protein
LVGTARTDAGSTAWIERQVGSLALSEIEGTAALALARAVVWHDVLVRLGIAVPLVVVHDLGALLAGIGRPATVRRGSGEAATAEGWRQLLVDLAESDIVRSPGPWKHRDAMIGVVLAKVLSTVVPNLPDDARAQRAAPMQIDPSAYLRLDPRALHARWDQEWATTWLRTMTRSRLAITLELEQLDVDALRLLGLFRGRGDQGDADLADLADLYGVLVTPALADVIDFSLELLPSLLEVKRDSGQQSFGIDGYASIERMGKLEGLLLSELAYDEDLFLQKLVEGELFHFTHEKQWENEERLHLVCVDGSASMRGAREVFARGFGLALGKRLALGGEQVQIRFFDSRVYEGVRVGGAGQEIPYVLSFRSERGRNHAAVVRQLAAELAAPRRAGVRVFVHLVTHGEFAVSRAEFQALTSLAPVQMVFVLPRGTVQAPYLDLAHKIHVVDEAAMRQDRRAGRAREVIRDVVRDTERARTGGRP